MTVLPRMGLEHRTIGQQSSALTVRPFNADVYDRFMFSQNLFIEYFVLVLYFNYDNDIINYRFIYVLGTCVPILLNIIYLCLHFYFSDLEIVLRMIC